MGVSRGLAWARKRAPRPVKMLRFWLIATSIILAVLAVWAFVPVLVLLVLLTAALGIVCAGMIGFARALQTWRDRR